MSEYKVGDLVKCVKMFGPYESEEPEIGKIYTIQKLYNSTAAEAVCGAGSSFIYLTELPNFLWSINRFEAYQRQPEKDNTFWSKLKEQEMSETPASISNKEQAKYFFAKGLELEDGKDQFAEAELAYKRALDFDPNFSAALVNLGKIASSRSLEEAKALFEKAVLMKDAILLAYYNLGWVQFQLGDKYSAACNYRKVLDLGDARPANPIRSDAEINLKIVLIDLKSTLPVEIYSRLRAGLNID